jgi:regulator of protease activity HflC (stomatin/prohibitin superfamily)
MGAHSDFSISTTTWLLWIHAKFAFDRVIKLIFLTFFLSLQVVQEYERAVIFRLGRLMAGGAKGPGRRFVQLNHSKT